MHPTAAKLQARLHAVGLEVEVQMMPSSARTAPEAAAAVGCEVGQIVKSLVFMRRAGDGSGDRAGAAAGEGAVAGDGVAAWDRAAPGDGAAAWDRAAAGDGAAAGEEPVIVLCAGDRRVSAERLALRAATAEEARGATGFAIGGIPPLGHDRPLQTLVDQSLRRFATVWCAAGTPHAVFEVDSEALIAAIPGAAILDVS